MDLSNNKFLVTAVMAIACSLMMQAQVNSGEMVTNGGFEQGGLPPQGWSQDPAMAKKGKTSLDNSKVHLGHASLKLEPNSHNTGQQLAIGQRFSADSYRGQKVELSAFMLAQGGATAHVGILSIIGGQPSNLQMLTVSDGNSDWTRQQLVYTVPDQPGVQLAVTCWVDGKLGAAWFDDISVVSAAGAAAAQGAPGAAIPTSGRALDYNAPVAANESTRWKEYSKDPIIKLGQDVPSMFWNDPSVLKDGDVYRMWLSGGNPKNPNHIVVEVFEATSSDGIKWKINPTPCLQPGSRPGDWDGLRVETPSVIKVGDTYHLYYTGFDQHTAIDGTGSIGHATSPDGIHWTKDPANPVVRAQNNDRFKWGTRGTGEPGVVYSPKDGIFYLYYVSMRFERAAPDIGEIGILLATSMDGSRFTAYSDARGERALVLTRSLPGARAGNWFGYSTPAALITRDGKFHLFCAFLVTSPAGSSHRAIDHATSDDGIHYSIVEQNILIAGTGDWKNDQVRGPTAVEVDGKLKIWFAGEARRPMFTWGIGYASN